MKVFNIRGWKELNNAFAKWYYFEGHPSWTRQRNWLSKEIVKRKFLNKDQLPEMWKIFNKLTDNFSTWTAQKKVLSFIIFCLNAVSERF